MAEGRDLALLLREIEAYVEKLFVPRDEALEKALEDSRREGLPQIQVSRNQGRLLNLLAGIVGARRILEIGTLGGYSTICLARALPEEGRLISLEISEHHAGVARRNIERAGLSSRVEVRLGNAKRLLAELAESGEDPFDLVFIDADKEGYPEYLEWSIRLSRPGTVILADNTIRGGSVLDPHDASSRAMREFNERLARDERLSATIVPMLRERVDGLAVARVIDL